MLNEIRVLLPGLVPRGSELDVEAVVDLVADWRDGVFPGSRFDNEAGVLWMCCCNFPPGIERGPKSEEYRRQILAVRERYRGIAGNPLLLRQLLEGLMPRAAYVRPGDPLAQLSEVFRDVDERDDGLTVDPRAPSPLSPEPLTDVEPSHTPEDEEESALEFE